MTTPHLEFTFTPESKGAGPDTCLPDEHPTRLFITLQRAAAFDLLRTLVDQVEAGIASGEGFIQIDLRGLGVCRAFVTEEDESGEGVAVDPRSVSPVAEHEGS